MKVRAPGKLLLAGAYAVLEGAPALVVAVDRFAIADGARVAKSPTPEVLAAMPAATAPEVDASDLRAEGAKLGLGSSAAMLVASLGVSYVRADRDLCASDVRDALFIEARRAHGAVQSGGSGVDVAASVYGGVLEYVLEGGEGRATPVRLPTGLVLDVFWCGVPAVTMGMRARVADLARRDGRAYQARMNDLAAAASAALRGTNADDLAAFLDAERAGAQALAALGHDADTPIIPPALVDLGPLAAGAGGAFLPSGAGGGDVFVHLGALPPSADFMAAASAAGMRRIPMHLDPDGVRLVPPVS